MYTYTLFLLLLVSHSLKLAVSLEAVTINQRLPSPRESLRAVYDGDDKVFLFGGYAFFPGYNRLDEVLEFSLSTEEIQIVGRFPDGISHGTAEFAHGYTYYFGGVTSSGNYSSYIWTTSKTRLNPYPVANFPTRIAGHGSAFDGGDSIYVFGGYSDSSYLRSIHKYSISNNTSNVVSDLPYGIYGCASIWFNNSAYIFGGSGEATNDGVIKFTPSAEGSELDILPVEIPTQFYLGSVVTDGRLIYMVQGFNQREDGKIVIFDPTTLNISMEEVTGLDSARGSSVYIAKTNRIYVFGGYNENSFSPSNRIRYINL